MLSLHINKFIYLYGSEKFLYIGILDKQFYFYFAVGSSEQEVAVSSEFLSAEHIVLSQR